ncbi:MAG: ATPase [Verrucomicrobiota bacterium]
MSALSPSLPSRIPLRKLAMPCALLLVWLFFIFKIDGEAFSGGESPRFLFLSARNLSQLLIEYSIIATLSLGMFMVILASHIDLSVGSGVGLTGGIAAVLATQKGWPAPLALGTALLCALVLWFCIGTLVVRQKMPSFIITLGGLLIFKGLFWLVIDNATVPVSPGGKDNLYSLLTTYSLPESAGLALGVAAAAVIAFLQWRGRRERIRYQLPAGGAGMPAVRAAAGALAVLAVVMVCNQFRGVPLSLLIIAGVAVTVYFLTEHTPFGRNLYAIGGNEEAAAIAGINVGRTIIGAFVLMGVAVAITGFMSTAYTGTSTTTVGDLMELDAIAACVIGGTSLKGGRGTVVGVLLGAFIMTSLLNGMTLMAVSPEIKYIARGAVLAFAVWMDVRFSRS